MSAEFRTLCHSLGLSAQALARLERVQQRTVEHWFAAGEPPAAVLGNVQRLQAAIEEMALQAVDAVLNATEQRGHAPEAVDLKAYRTAESWWAAHPEFNGLPIQTHGIMLHRQAQALRNIGVAVAIGY